MKRLVACFLAAVLSLLGASEAMACHPEGPERLRSVQADAIVLVQITDVTESQDRWTAIAATRGALLGSMPAEFELAQPEVVTCDQMGRPKLDRYYVLYFTDTPAGRQLSRAVPFWWARTSGDPRLSGLDELMPLGAARTATSEEDLLLDLAEATVTDAFPEIDISGYTRVYSRDAPAWVNAVFLRAQEPRRLMVDGHEELPTDKSCRCDLIELFLELDDLWAAGRLPPFNP